MQSNRAYHWTYEEEVRLHPPHISSTVLYQYLLRAVGERHAETNLVIALQRNSFREL